MNSPLYINMPGSVLTNKSLSSTEKILYSYFLGLAMSGQEIYSSNEYLCSIVDIKERHLREIFEHLESLSLIRRINKGNKRYIQVTNIDLKCIEIDQKEGGRKNAGGAAVKRRGGGGKTPPYIKVNIKANNISHERENSKINFDQFWNIIDKKDYPVDTEKLWNTLTIEEQKFAINDYPARYAGRTNGFYPSPVTYLRNKSWKQALPQNCDKNSNKNTTSLNIEPYFSKEQHERNSKQQHEARIELYKQALQDKGFSSYGKSQNHSTTRLKRAPQSIKTYLMGDKT